MGFGAGRRDGRDGRARPRPRARAVSRRCALVAPACCAAAPTRRRPALAAEASPTARRWSCWRSRNAPRATAWTHVDDAGRSTPAATWQLTGSKIVVPAGDAGRRLHRAGAGQRRRRRRGRHRPVPRRSGERGVEVRGYPTQDGARAADLTLITRQRDRADGARRRRFAALEHAIDVGIAALCAEAVGVMDKLVAITVEYMNTRKQFGVPIATLPGAAPPHRRRQDAARAGALDELLREPEARRAGAGSAAARCRRPSCSSASRCASSASSASSCTAASACTDEYIGQPLLQAPDGAWR